MTSKQTIVLVEDDLELNQMISGFLQEEGYLVTSIYNGNDAVGAIVNQNPDLVILDLMLPGIDGIEICRRIRTKYINPIVMLTAKDDDLVEVASLQQGVDNYLNKPIRPHVLLAHVQAALRRSTISVKPTNPVNLVVQDITLDPESLRVTLSDESLDLTTGEFELLAVLMENAGLPVSRDKLYKLTQGIEYDGLDRSIDLRISNLRKKLNDESPPYRYIKTVRGKGYLMSKR
ncbi:MAG: response regulator transcription factor [Candidatus Thiodiazotropha sp.]|nr:response regulator transcription factor [Candidatus Thiodiazotropha sp.]MCM8884706.1 response regulator transcription factor [Candidatus Thiodiazotropha sp.]MCM8922215.1 response regulator transcription factor [Candidatus Thiodiazotropha sp.]